MLGITNRVKALFAGRTGPPLLQTYFDLARLLGKGAVYSRTTTVLFRLGPMIGLAAVVTASLLVPFGGRPGTMPFEGDLILFAYLLGLARLFTVLAALDTGSAFEGMGTSRELLFSALAEPALLLSLVAVGHEVGSFSISGLHNPVSGVSWQESAITLVLVGVVLFVVFLSENSRIPVDDPNTHLELTMIHEVMVLDHSGPDLAFILYGAALKLWLLASLLVAVVVPMHSGYWAVDLATGLAGMFGMAVALGTVESVMARLRMSLVPELLVGATVVAGLALMIGYGGAVR
jgi:formate hydrogenlyase subunit 4